MSISFESFYHASVASDQFAFEGFDEPEADLLPWPAFAATTTTHLRSLRDIRNPVALFAIRLTDLSTGLSSSLSACLVADALAPLGVIGELFDKRVGLLYLGPLGRGDEAKFLQHLKRRIAYKLESSGISIAPRLIEITPHFAWTNEVSCAEDLVQALPAARNQAQPTRSLAFA